MALRVYVAAPFQRRVDAAGVNVRLASVGLVATASWMHVGEGSDSELTLARAREQAAKNDAEIDGSHAMLVLTSDGAGGEMFSEIGRAVQARMPIVWTGPRRTLSLRRRGTVEAATIDDALGQLVVWDAFSRRPWETEPDWVRAIIWNTLEDIELGLESKGAA